MKNAVQFIYSDIKEQVCIQPVHDSLKKFTNTSINTLNRVNHKIKYTVVGYNLTINQLKTIGYTGKIIHLEHGLGILKNYTVRPHNIEVDLNILPGEFWRERLDKKFRDYETKLVVGGFPKSDKMINGNINKNQMCKELNLNCNEPIILYAPTWSRNAAGLGMDNLKHFAGISNVLAVPHNADYKYANQYTGNIRIPKTTGDITPYLNLADILVTDISSVGVEFSILKKPVIHLILPEHSTHSQGDVIRHYPDCTAKMTDDGYFIENTTGDVINYSIPTRPENLKETIDCICKNGTSKEYTEQQQYWVDRIVYNPNGRTSDRCAEIILDYINETETEEDENNEQRHNIRYV